MIAYVRSQFASDQIPDWVGDFKGSYTETLRKAGIEVLDAMDADDEGGVGSMGDEGSDEQEHVPTPPAKRSSSRQTGNHPQAQSENHKQPPHTSHKQPQPEPSITTHNQPQIEEKPSKQVMGKLAAKKAAKDAVIPPQLKTIPTPPVKLTRGQELPQRRDKPRARLVLNPQGVPVGIRPVEKSPVMGASRLNRLIAERLSEEDIEMKTFALMKKVALNPALSLGYAWVTSNVNYDGDPLFKGDISDWINECCAHGLPSVCAPEC